MCVSVCTYGSCERPLLIVAICVIAAFLLIVPGCYCAVLHKLKSIAYSEKCTTNRRSRRRKCTNSSTSEHTSACMRSFRR
ncbi:hypothetical protein ANCCAN_26521 [Ancylostoma caninum]|uniref:Uncharacterized protein n=1 Tax=Ancylostoma caninum TaxID=29170 RepID=A0A368F6P8_ANCCA|nr:hypothetical protein ANCCAN_26521 [Ancylostoma caninum]